jgi:hypothetical protein
VNQKCKNAEKSCFWLQLVLSAFLAFSLTACNFLNPSSRDDDDGVEIEVPTLEISYPLASIEMYLNDTKLGFPGEEFGEIEEKANFSVKSVLTQLNFRVRYYVGEDFQGESSYQDLVSNVHEWQGEFSARGGVATTYHFEILPQAQAPAKIADAESASVRIVVFTVYPKGNKPPGPDAALLTAAELAPNIYINGDLLDDNDFEQELTFTKAVSLMVSPKEKVLFEVSVKESDGGKFHELTKPDGESQVELFGIGKILPNTPNTVMVEIISYQAGNKNNALKKTFQFIVDGSGAVPVLSKNGALLSKNSAFYEDSLTLSFTRKPEYNYSVYVTSVPNIYAPKKHFHLYPKNFSGDNFAISLNGQDSVDFKVYIKAVNKVSDAKLSQRYFITLTKPDPSVIEFRLLVDGIALPASTNYELDLDPINTANLRLPKVSDLTYTVSCEVNNIAQAPLVGLIEYNRTLAIVGNNKTYYKFSIIATNSAGKERKKEYSITLNPKSATVLLGKMQILEDLHQKRLVAQLLLTKIKSIVESAFYTDAAKNQIIADLKNRNTAAAMESGNASTISTGSRDALKHYKSSGYSDINRYLRFGTKPVFGYKCSIYSDGEADVKECVKKIDQIMDIAAQKPQLATTQVMYVYRGGFVNPVYDKNTPGEFNEASYVSTSLNQSTAMGFYAGENSKFRYQLEDSSLFFVKKTAALWRIRIPIGTKVLFLENICDGLLAAENEVLLPRNSHFKILDGLESAPHFYDYVPGFNPLAKCEICSPVTYDAYRTVNLELILP